ncbi:MAG: condensation protein [Methanomicrobiaceae archaeon]|nr:condensation protein [Methanomicrobiaceae archaeon]
MNNFEEELRTPAPVFDVFNVYFDCIYEPTMHILFEFDGRIDGKCLENALTKAINADPYLSSRYIEKDKIPFWEKIPSVFFKEAFYLQEISKPEENIFANPPPALDVYKGPQVRAGLYRSKKGDSIVISCHHGFCDAKGLKDLSSEIFSIYQKLQRNPDYMPESKGWYYRGTKDILEKNSKNKIKDALAAEEPFIDRWAFPFEYKGRGNPCYTVRELNPERFGKIKEFGKKYGATVNDIIIAAYILALLKIAPSNSENDLKKTLLTSADIRKYYGRDKDNLPQNLSVAYEISVIADENSELTDVIGQITDITRKKKSGDLGLGCIAFYEEIFKEGMDNLRLFFNNMVSGYDSSNLKNPVFSNIGIIDTDCFLPVLGTDNKILELKNAVFLPVICWPAGFLMTISTFRDTITLISGYEEGPYSKKTVETFLEYVDSYIP